MDLSASTGFRKPVFPLRPTARERRSTATGRRCRDLPGICFMQPISPVRPQAGSREKNTCPHRSAAFPSAPDPTRPFAQAVGGHILNDRRRRGIMPRLNHILLELTKRRSAIESLPDTDLALACSVQLADHRRPDGAPSRSRHCWPHLASVDAWVPLVFLHVQTLAHANEHSATDIFRRFWPLQARIALARKFPGSAAAADQPVRRSVQLGRARAFIFARCRQKRRSWNAQKIMAARRPSAAHAAEVPSHPVTASRQSRLFQSARHSASGIHGSP